MLFALSWLQKKLNVNDLPDEPTPLIYDPSDDIFYGFFKNKNLRGVQKMKWRVEIVQTNVFYIEAETEDQALDIAARERIWDEDQTAPDTYSYHHNIEEVSDED